MIPVLLVAVWCGPLTGAKVLAAPDPLHSAGLPLELSALPWAVHQGWSPEDRAGFAWDGPAVARPKRFPLIPDRLFAYQPQDKPLHFGLMTRFTLSPQALTGLDPLAIYLPVVGENWEVFVNGQPVRDEMTLDESGFIARRRTLMGVLFPLDKSLFHAGENTLVFHLAGDAMPSGWVSNSLLGLLSTKPYLLGGYQQLEAMTSRNLELSMQVIYLFLAFFLLMFYLRRKQEFHFLHLGLFSLLLAVFYLAYHPVMVRLVDDTEWLTRARWVALAGMGPLLLLFLETYFFEDKRLPWFIKLFLVLPVPLAAGFLVLPLAVAQIGLRVWQVYALGAIVVGGYFLVRGLREKTHDARGVSAIFLGFILVVGLDIGWDMATQTRLGYTQYTFFVVVLALVMLIVNRFIVLHAREELLNAQLTRQKNAFFRFVPTQFLSLLGKQSAEEIDLGNSSAQTMSVLFCDIRSFTSLSEKMTPEETFRFLNGYLAFMEPSISTHGGFVDKFMGDGIMALFALPLGDKAGEASSERALMAALRMLGSLEAFNGLRVMEGAPPIRIGIGIHTGPLTLGTVGSTGRLDTTVIGDTVNLASRVESLTSHFKVDLMITEDVVKGLARPVDWPMREIGLAVVKGRTRPITLYEVFQAEKEGSRQLKMESAPAFAQALASYRQGRFLQAQGGFAAIAAQNPDDRLAAFYQQQCNRMIENPPPPGWDGVEVFTHK